MEMRTNMENKEPKQLTLEEQIEQVKIDMLEGIHEAVQQGYMSEGEALQFYLEWQERFGK